jgi:hypothetical protein
MEGPTVEGSSELPDALRREHLRYAARMVWCVRTELSDIDSNVANEAQILLQGATFGSEA